MSTSPYMPIQLGQGVQVHRGVGMVGAESLLCDPQRALLERFGLGVGAHILVEHGEVVQARRGVGMVGAECLLADRQHLHCRRQGFLVAAGPVEFDHLRAQPCRIIVIRGIGRHGPLHRLCCKRYGRRQQRKRHHYRAHPMVHRAPIALIPGSLHCALIPCYDDNAR